MEKNKICRNCGAHLLEQDKFCPICGLSVKKSEEKNYWRSYKIWIVFLSLLLITSCMTVYLNENPIEITSNEKKSTNNVAKNNFEVNGVTNKYSQATNINATGYSYVNEQGVYIAANDKLYVFDKDLNSKEEVLDISLNNFSENNDAYFFVNENNDYIKLDKVTNQETVLLKNVFYVHNLGDKIVYQNDTDEETIHCLNLVDNSDVRLNDEASYNLIVDEGNSIFYINENGILVSIAMDGSNRKELATAILTYTYDGEDIYCITIDGLVKITKDNEVELIYENNGLQLVNIVNDKIIVQDRNTIYAMNLSGKNVKKLYTMDIGGQIAFEILGDKILILASGMGDTVITYEVISIDGSRQLLDTDDLSSGIGFEF